MKMTMKNFKENSIAIAVSASPFTLLRVFNLGITEVIMVAIFFYIIQKSNLKIYYSQKNRISESFAILLIMALVGFIYNYLFLGGVGTFDSALFNFLALFAVWLSCYSTEFFVSLGSIDSKMILDKIYFELSSIVLFFFVVGQFKESIFGYPIMYFGYFSPLSDNIHQLAMLLAFIPFIGCYLYEKETSIHRKYLIAILFVTNVYIGYNTGSAKFVLAIISGIFTIMLYKLSDLSGKFKNIILLLYVSAAVMGSFIFIDELINLFRDNDINGGREWLYFNGIEAILSSPLFGYGPSNIIKDMSGTYKDAHETLLTIFLTGGIIALVSFFKMLIYVFNKVRKNKYLIASFIGFCIYLLGGDVLRKESLWIIIILLVDQANNSKIR